MDIAAWLARGVGQPGVVATGGVCSRYMAMVASQNLRSGTHSWICVPDTLSPAVNP